VVAVQRDVLLEVFGDGTAVDAADGRYNVLLLGGDSGAERWGVRPDSLTLASIDAETGRTVLLSLPRNLENVPFPADSPMGEAFPNGFDCESCYLNSVYTYARTHRTLFPGVDNPGLEATVQAVETITGLPVHYYAMVNMRGFSKLVDAVGGVTLRVRTEIAIGGGTGAITGTIEPGVHRLDGEQTLWYARSRAYDDDYSRMGRQKCVMAAMLAQLDPRRVLLHVQEIARASAQMLSTDIPHQELDTFVGLALKARKEPITTVSFVPPMIDTYDPDYDLIGEKVDAAIARAESTAKPSNGGKTPGAAQSNRAVKAANHSDDLQSTC
jgi:LCP family protein required for cell wall assembly